MDMIWYLNVLVVSGIYGKSTELCTTRTCVWKCWRFASETKLRAYYPRLLLQKVLHLYYIKWYLFKVKKIAQCQIYFIQLHKTNTVYFTILSTVTRAEFLVSSTAITKGTWLCYLFLHWPALLHCRSGEE